MPNGTKTAREVASLIAADLATGLSLRKTARRHGVPVSTVADIGKRGGLQMDHTEERGWSEGSGEATLEFRTPEIVRTEADAIRVGKVDLTRWRVKRWTLKTYQVCTKNKLIDKTHETKVTQLYAVKLDLESILPKPYLDASEALWKRLEERSPHFDFSQPVPVDASLLCELDLFDVHFGKLCWAPESGENDDLRITERKFRYAIDDLLVKLRGQAVSRFVLPLGNDLFHVDSLLRATTAGTPQDADGRYAKMIEIGEASVLAAVDRLQRIAPVDVIYVPGNHDRLASYHLCRTASAWFRNCERVSVDLSPAVRKYRRYGCNLFGYTHGDRVNGDAGIRSLPALMAVESPQDWGQTTCREWKLGHRHTSRRFETRSSDEFQGVQVRWLSSLSGTDAWHFENGFVANRRAAEAYLYDLNHGYSGHSVAYARPS
jgi:hypothetical protein